MSANRLIRWARSFDRKMDAYYNKIESDNAIYRETLRAERLDLHDKESNTLYIMAFKDWFFGLKSRVPIIYID